MGEGDEGRPATAIVLFTDVVGSTRLRQTLGDDQADQLRRQHDRLLAEAVAGHGGTEVKGMGDGLMAVFGAAAEAVGAAVAMQRAIDRLTRRAQSPLGLRVGISAGDVSWEGSDCFGTPVVEASRLCGAAEGGQILVSEIVRLLAGSRGGHAFSLVGPIELKGLTDPVVAHQVEWVPAAAASLPLPPALETVESVSFVGRIAHRESLQRAWKEALAGARRVVLVSGEPGVGKTRIAAELARHANEDGATVLFGRCDEDLGVPYQPFAEALTAFVSACPASELSEQLGVYAGDLARLAPELAERVKELPAPLRAEPETERHRLFEAVDGFVVAASTAAPVVLILDDLHWAAQATLLLLRHLVRSARPGRVLVIGTYRDTDLGRGHPLADVLADLRREPNVERLDLQGLDEGEVAAFMEAAAGHVLDEASGALAQRLHAETEGNPFFVGQVLRNLAESGALVQRDGRWTTIGSVVRLPEGVREVIGRRLSRLPESTTQVLEVAAVIGREFEDRLLSEASEGDREAFLDALERAEGARLVESVPGTTGRHAFVHALVRSTLYEELPTTRRLRLHRRIGLALEARGGADSDKTLPELARHFAEAAGLGEDSKAAEYGVRAARAARRRLAYEEAVAFCEQALAAVDPDDSATSEARVELLLEKGEAHLAAGDWSRTNEASEQAVVLGRRMGRPDILARAVLCRRGRGFGEAGVIDDEVVARLEEALATLPGGDSDLRAKCLARLGGELYFLPGAEGRVQGLLADAVAMARRLGEPDTLGFILSVAAWMWAPTGEESERVVERLAFGRELAELGRATANREDEFYGVGFQVGPLLALLQRDQLDAAVERMGALAGELRQPMCDWWMLVTKAMVALVDGRLAEASALSDEAFVRGQQGIMLVQQYGVQLFALRRWAGGLEEVVPLVVSMVDSYPLIPAWRSALAFNCAETGRFAEAAAEMDRLAVDDFTVLPHDANWLPAVTLLAIVAHALDDRARAASLYDLLLPFAGQAVPVGVPAITIGSVSAHLALAAATTERWDDWERHSAEGRRHHQLLRSPPLLAEFALRDARVLARRGQPGDAERALELVETCRAEAERLGMAWIVEQANDLHRLLVGPGAS